MRRSMRLRAITQPKSLSGSLYRSLQAYLGLIMLKKIKKYIKTHLVPANLHMLPDFIIIGSMKCGTTSLFQYLAQHSDIMVSKKKEIHYFDFGYSKGLEWYRRQFPTKLEKAKKRLNGSHILTGEASPYYMFHPHACKRMATLLPEAKLIVLLRNPVDRAFSHYYNEIRHERESLSFEEALEAEPGRLAGEVQKMMEDENYFSFHHGHHAYLARGIYVDQIRQVREHYSEDQLLVLDSDLLFSEPQQTCNLVFDFLGLPPWKIKEFKIHNPGQYQNPMSTELRNKLVDYYFPYNQALYEYLEVKFDWDK